MENNNLTNASILLGVSLKSLKTLPEDKQNEITAVMEMVEINSEEDAVNVYDELYRIWLSAVNEQ